ncbi:HAMP domain-containing sensor histidine kinase [uncultured Microbacterium sp.]|uniref:sensor histidine kinase n=1 Tax=uncultured Microbacterium sp. TaxID=191216 RepID=UPI0028DC92C8|nr:HAMP domain-containing sensor histidine kinase [uncultured Microbacterium sp.]
MRSVDRRRGLSARLKLALSYAAVVAGTGAVLLTVVGLFLLRYVPDVQIVADVRVPNRRDLLRAFAPVATWAMIGLLVVGLVGGWLLAGRMLSPLSRIGAAAQLAARGSLSHRVALPGARDEFRDLADVFDGMLAQLEAHVDEQRRFAANASHELRTPLAISQTLLEVARNDPDRDADALIARLYEVNARAIELTEALLLLSRAERRSFTRETVDVSLIAEDAVETLLPLADRRGVAVEVGETVVGPGGDQASAAGVVLGSGALLQQLVANLVHNAIVHNLPAGGRVAVRVHELHDAVALVVENTGPSVAPERLDSLVEPFHRGAERTRSDDHAGAGLGLAIAERITQAHDGSLILTARPDGGLIVTVWLPRA